MPRLATVVGLPRSPDEEHETLEAGPRVTIITVPDAGHMVMTDQPARVAELVARAVLG